MIIKLHRSFRLNLIRLRELYDLTKRLETKTYTPTATDILEIAIRQLAENKGVAHDICKWLSKKHKKQIFCIAPSKSRKWEDTDECIECNQWRDY